MEELNLLAGQHIFIIIVLLAVVIFILLIMLVMTRKKLAVMQDKYDYFTKGSEVNIDQVLTRTLQELEKTQAELQQLQQKHGQLREQVKGCIQKVKMERYDAFDAMGGEMSYSILLANENNDGIILTSIYGREDNRCYAKDVKGGKSSYVLAEEEKKLL